MAKFNYTILIQQGVSERGNDEHKIINAMYASLREYLTNEINERNKFFSEIIQRAQQRLSGSLAPYLSTPLKSDKNDIASSIQDTINDVLQQSGTGITKTPLPVTISRIVEPANIPLQKQSVSLMRQLIKNRKSLLPHVHLNKGKRSGNRFFIDFCTDDFSLVPMLYRSVEITLNKHSDDNFSITSECMTETVTLFTPATVTSKQRVIFYTDQLDSGNVQLPEKFKTLIEQFELENVSVARKIFKTGFGFNNQIQFDVDVTKVPLGSVITSLFGNNKNDEESLVTQGALVVLEKMPE